MILQISTELENAMAFIPAIDTVQANIRFTMDGQPAENVFNFRRTGGYVQADLDALAAAIDQWVHDDLIALQNDRTTYRETYVKGLESLIDLQATDNTNTGDVGVLANAQANNVTKAITFRTGFTGRSARGRMYHIGIAIGQLTNTNTVNQTFVDDLIAALEALKVIIEALGWVWVIVSKYTGGAPRTSAVMTPVTSFGVSNLSVDSMRGRLG